MAQASIGSGFASSLTAVDCDDVGLVSALATRASAIPSAASATPPTVATFAANLRPRARASDRFVVLLVLLVLLMVDTSATASSNTRSAPVALGYEGLHIEWFNQLRRLRTSSAKRDSQQSCAAGRIA